MDIIDTKGVYGVMGPLLISVLKDSQRGNLHFIHVSNGL